MRIVVDVTHPGHVHFFKHAIWACQARGHDVRILARDRDIIIELLRAYKLPFVSMGKAGRGLVGLGLELIRYEARVLRELLRFKPDIVLEIGGTFVVHAAKLAGIPSIVFTDTEHARLTNSITFPFASVICTPECYFDDLGKRQVRYAGYQELAYLHPRYFTPDPNVLANAGLDLRERLIVLRFGSWQAAHDIGQQGFINRASLVRELERYGRVLITSEGKLPAELLQYGMTITPEKIHDLLYYATMYIGEGGTMASEAALLGTPSIFVSTLALGYLEELEHRYGLVYSFANQDRALEKALELLRDIDIKDKWQTKRRKMLAEKIDVTQFIVDVVERYGLEHQRRSRRGS